MRCDRHFLFHMRNKLLKRSFEKYFTHFAPSLVWIELITLYINSLHSSVHIKYMYMMPHTLKIKFYPETECATLRGENLHERRLADIASRDEKSLACISKNKMKVFCLEVQTGCQIVHLVGMRGFIKFLRWREFF